MALLDDVKTIVATKVKSLGDIDNDLLSVTVDEIKVVIQEYCNIDRIPEGLKFTWANMAEDQYRYYNALSNPQPTQTLSMGDISQLKIGDTTINVDASKNNSQYKKALRSHTSNLDSIVKNYRQQLNKYRRMVW